MSEKKSFLTTVDVFLTKSRKVLVNIVTAFFLLLITIFIISFFYSIFAKEEKINTIDKILYFEPSGVVVDTAISGTDPIMLLTNNIDVDQHEESKLLEILNSAASDENLKAVYIDVSGLSMYWSSAFAIAKAVKQIKDSGKPVISYAENYGNISYFISSQANKVFVNTNLGVVELSGFSRKREYYKDLYENIKLNYHVFVAGDFKTGPEPYTRNSMSENDKISWSAFIDPIWKEMTQMIETSRDLEEGHIQKYGDNFYELMVNTPDMPELALENNLVDGIMTWQEIKKYMISNYGDEDSSDEWPEGISSYEYYNFIQDNKEKNKSKNTIAVINVEGTITGTESALGIAGSKTIASNINKAKDDKNVKAIVLRVNSPGGIVWPSEIITNALDDFKETGRPIIASMGGIAASGGVWVTTVADEIWAQETTLTGSIGVYGLVPTIENLYEFVGIQVDGISQTKSGEWDPRMPMPEYVTKAIQSRVDNTYKKFVTKVAENRDMDFKDILAIAAGRIWSGVTAQEKGLVDKIGNLDDAITSAAEIAKLEDYKSVVYKKSLDPFDVFIAELITNIGINFSIDSRFLNFKNIILKYENLTEPNKNLNLIYYCFLCEIK